MRENHAQILDYDYLWGICQKGQKIQDGGFFSKVASKIILFLYSIQMLMEYISILSIKSI